MNDLWTMVWKETKDIILQKGTQAWIRPLLVIAILGIVFPWQLGLRWLELSPIMLVLNLYIPFLQIINVIGDAIAGERERHTLETLLASRISDRAILLGKIIVTIGFAWGMTLISLLIGLMVANLTGGQGTFVFYAPLNQFLEMVVLCLLVYLLAASAGVLISQHSTTVRQAQQTLSLSTIVLFVGSILALKAVPASTIASLSYNQVLLVGLVVVAVLDAILLGISLSSFRRSRLILS
jgi:ABC-2 type transport system permease protein